MAQVPYSGVPDVVPTAPAAPKIGVDTPPSAFGVTTAEAEERLGGQVEKTGDMLAQNALAIQAIRNDTWSKDEFVRQSGKLGEIEANFYKLKGADAVAARPQYEQDVQNLYKDAIDGAPNMQARRMLADTLSRRVSYSIVDGQRHAGEQEGAYRKTVNSDYVAEAMSDVAQHPYNDKGFADAVTKIKSTAADQANESGEGKEGYNRRTEQYISQLWDFRLQSIAAENPAAARDLFNRNKDQIKGIAQNGEPYLLKIQKMIDQQDVRIGTRQVAHDILFGGVVTEGTSLADLDQARQADTSLTPAQRAGAAPLPVGWAQKHGGKQSVLDADAGDDFLQRALQAGQQYVQDHNSSPEYQDELTRRITQDYNTFSNAAKRATYGSYVNVASAVTGASGGTPITRMDDIYNNPNLNAEWSKLSDTAYGRDKQRQIQTMITNQYNKGGLPADEQTALFNKVMGMAVAAKSDPVARDAFTGLDMGDLSGKLSQPLIRQLNAEQRQVAQVWANKTEHLEQNNRFNSVMQFLKPTLESAGIRASATDKAANDRYLEFQGAMYQKVLKYEQDTQKPLTDQTQMMGLAAPLLQQMGSRSFSNLWGMIGRMPAAYEVPATVSAKIIENFKNRPENTTKAPPTAFQLGQAYQAILANPELRAKYGLE